MYILYMNNKNKYFLKGMCAAGVQWAHACKNIILIRGSPTCVKGAEQIPRPTLKDVMLVCTGSVDSPNFSIPGFLNRTLS